MLSKEEFQAHIDSGFNIIPVVESLPIENQTPLTLYSQVSKKNNTFLLESVEGGDRWSQYSIIGFNCSDIIKVTGNVVELKKSNKVTSITSDDPLGEIQKITSSFKSPNVIDLPRFHGGFVGFFAYESARYAEKRISDLSSKGSKFKKHMPEIFLVKAEQLVVYDNFNNSAQVIFNADPAKHSYDVVQERINEMKAYFSSSSNLEELKFKEPKGSTHFESNFKKEEYLDAVNTIKNYIKEGDVFQVVLAQDFYSKFDLDPFHLYRAIRKLNPSPYMYYLDLEECQVVGSSPEILVRLEDTKLTLRPIAGTRKRGKDLEEDKQNEEDLLNDPKELAEHLMLIDLGRNDVGRVSEIGSVKVTDKMVIEKYSHVMHIVSNVEGTLSKDLDYLDALKASLPAGTLSGAPKIRAMEIINELEPSSRGIYGGAIGYISWNGNIDTAIAIRTAVIKDNKIHVGAGAGIVADSVPENEWLECIQKSKAFIDALEMIS